MNDVTLNQVPEFTEGGVTQYPVPAAETEKPTSKIGITKKSREQSKTKRRMARESRKINRRK